MIDSYFSLKLQHFDLFDNSLKLQHFDWLDILHSNFKILIDSYCFDQISVFWSIWLFALKFQAKFWSVFLPFRLNFIILINSYYFTQIATFWLLLFHSNYNILINLTFALKIQHSDQFQLFHLNCNILHWNFNILSDSYYFIESATFWLISPSSLKLQHFDRWTFCTQISKCWLIPTVSIKFQYFDRFDILLWNFNILIDSYHFDQISVLTFCTSISIFDRFLPFWSNLITMINSYYFTQIATFWLIQYFFTKITTFWSIWHFALKIQHSDQSHLFHSNCNILINWTFCTQISTFWLIPIISIKLQYLIWSIPTILLKLQHFDQFLICHSNCNILINS